MSDQLTLSGGTQPPASAVTSPGLVVSHISADADPEPRVEINVFAQDVRVHRRQRRLGSRHSGGGRRGRITGLSPGAARRLLHAARNVTGLTVALDLTYPQEFPQDGRVVKQHWKAMREWLTRLRLGGLWILEFQRRGAPHFTIFLNGPVDRAAVAARWAAIVNSGDPRHERAGTRVARIRKPYAVAVYATKYASKQAQKEVPSEYADVGQMWGLFGGVRPRPQASVAGPAHEMAPALRVLRGLDRSARRARGCGPQRDNGVAGWTMWGLAPRAAGCLARLDLDAGPEER